MAEVNQEIIDAIIARLSSITIANGYSFDVPLVEKPNRDRDDWMPQQNAIYVEKIEQFQNDNYTCPGSPARIGWDMVIAINGYCKRIDLDAEEFGENDEPVSENVMAAAIQKAITNNDPGSWHTFGGYAKNARFSRSEEFDEPGWDGVSVRMIITYRTSELDATVVG